MSAGSFGRAQPRALGRIDRDAVLHQQPRRALGVLASGFVLIGGWACPERCAAAAGSTCARRVVWMCRRPRAIRAAAAIRPGMPRSANAVRGRAADRPCVLRLRDLLDPDAVARARRVTHSFELMLSRIHPRLALGGFAVRRRVDRDRESRALLGWVQVAMGLAALATLPAYDATFGLMEWLMKGLSRNEAGYLFFNLSGQAVAAFVMLPATFCAGMTLPLITGALLRLGAGESAIGKVYAANTLGAIGGVLLAVHVGLPLLGLKGTLITGAAIDAALGLLLLYRFSAARRPFAIAAAACGAFFVPVATAFELDANKMTSGVFRHGDLSSSRDAKILFNKDGKTATVHLVLYPEATSIRTNGKSDGSINLKPEGERGSDEITMVLTGAVPLALKPQARTAAVIGIGTGLTMHTLLQSLTIERVETVEIESAMAEASRGFLPRNAAAFADPRGSILIDDAKTFFSTRNRRYDIIISEPSNPWVSGVSNLFTREFYRRIRTHLNPGGLLVQWFQLYEIDPSLVASVMNALGEEFAHYAVFAPSDHDVLIVASQEPIPYPRARRHSRSPGSRASCARACA
jgi:spermidine synthase